MFENLHYRFIDNMHVDARTGFKERCKRPEGGGKIGLHSAECHDLFLMETCLLDPDQFFNDDPKLNSKIHKLVSLEQKRNKSDEEMRLEKCLYQDYFHGAERTYLRNSQEGRLSFMSFSFAVNLNINSPYPLAYGLAVTSATMHGAEYMTFKEYDDDFYHNGFHTTKNMKRHEAEREFVEAIRKKPSLAGNCAGKSDKHPLELTPAEIVSWSFSRFTKEAVLQTAPKAGLEIYIIDDIKNIPNLKKFNETSKEKFSSWQLPLSAPLSFPDAMYNLRKVKQSLFKKTPDLAR